jgi:hypothetical protein
MLFSIASGRNTVRRSSVAENPPTVGAGMLFELDSDQLLWRTTVRDVLAKECPPALGCSVADQGADPGPL